MTADRLLRTSEAAEVLNVPEATLRWWRHVNRGPRSFAVGRAVMYRRSDLLAWLQHQQDETSRGDALPAGPTPVQRT